MSAITQPLIYPQPFPSHPSSASNGSFGPVFIVLSVISLLAAMACVGGRLCARRFSQQKPRQNCTNAASDIEFGFEPTTPEGKLRREKAATKNANLEFQFEMSNFDARLARKGGTNLRPGPADIEFEFKTNAPKATPKGRAATKQGGERNIGTTTHVKTKQMYDRKQ